MLSWQVKMMISKGMLKKKKKKWKKNSEQKYRVLVWVFLKTFRACISAHFSKAPVTFQNYWNFDLECKHGKHKTAFGSEKLSGLSSRGGLFLESPGNFSGRESYFVLLCFHSRWKFQ